MNDRELTKVLMCRELYGEHDICPFCGEDEVLRENPEIAPIGLLLEARCDACDKRWIETYTFHDAERVDKFYWEEED